MQAWIARLQRVLDPNGKYAWHLNEWTAFKSHGLDWWGRVWILFEHPVFLTRIDHAKRLLAPIQLSFLLGLVSRWSFSRRIHRIWRDSQRYCKRVFDNRVPCKEGNTFDISRRRKCLSSSYFPLFSLRYAMYTLGWIWLKSLNEKLNKFRLSNVLFLALSRRFSGPESAQVWSPSKSFDYLMFS
jgi:hypothetical protein